MHKRVDPLTKAMIQQAKRTAVNQATDQVVKLMLALPEHLTGVIYQKDAICKALASHETADPQEQQMLSDILEAVNGEDF